VTRVKCMGKSLFIASTGQHVGKTTLSLGILSGLRKLPLNAGFFKPVGQEELKTESGAVVDKDVVLFKETFQLLSSYSEMSPVLIPKGFTRSYLDKQVSEELLREKIKQGHAAIENQYDFVLVEGTGHTSVGSIINLNNAQVASLLGIPMILIATGGLGSAFDLLALNKAMCDAYHVPIKGVILNRVLPEKREMIIHYMTKALTRWNLPLLASIPYDPFLSNPSMKDFETLFETKLLTGEEHQMRHFTDTRLVATSVETYQKMILPCQLIITPANREDIILATIKKQWEIKKRDPHDDLMAGMILTGDHLPRKEIYEEIKQANIPMLYTPVHSYAVMKMISSFTAKIRNEDLAKVHEAIDLVEQHIDFEALLSDTICRK